jgi:hypothetical protein
MAPKGAQRSAAQSPFATVPVPTGYTSTSVSKSSAIRRSSRCVYWSPPYGAESSALDSTMARRISGAAPETLSL